MPKPERSADPAATPDPTPQPAATPPVDPISATARERQQARTFNFWEEMTEKGIVAAVLIGLAYLGGKLFETEDGRKAAGQAARVSLEVAGEIKDTLIDEDGEVGQFGRELDSWAKKHFVRDQVRGLQRERRYRRGLGFWRRLFHAALPFPAWSITMAEANRRKKETKKETKTPSAPATPAAPTTRGVIL